MKRGGSDFDITLCTHQEKKKEKLGKKQQKREKKQKREKNYTANILTVENTYVCLCSKSKYNYELNL